MQPLENCQDGGGKGKRKDVCYLELARIVQQAASMPNSFTPMPSPKSCLQRSPAHFLAVRISYLGVPVRTVFPVKDANCNRLK
jgi:hypothetical protein